jgi:hypothetical protein
VQQYLAFGQQACLCRRSIFILMTEHLLHEHWIFASRALAFVPTHSTFVQQCQQGTGQYR